MEHNPGDKCTWPFDHDPDCEECPKWETQYAENLDNYLKVRAEVLEAARQQQKAARELKRKRS